jgi:diaminohydroxyphosphoribosylaminopyrimidine deaminase/5-amino-6-(5-phosphoribosylamino)uracil reductase
MHPQQRALSLGEQGLGTTHPNPSVGCVLVDPGGTVVGEGRTEPPGGRHAEIVALDQAGARAEGSTAYVTLQPCTHTGRTGPCAVALRNAGVLDVVFAEVDPVHGGGVPGLPMRQEGSAPYLDPWLTATARQRPYVTWKTATTLDGRVAAPDGGSRWITGAQARADVHALRSRVDAVVTGVGSVLADDPELTDRRPVATHQPMRIVLDRTGRTPVGAKVHPATVLGQATAVEQLAAIYGLGVRHLLLECGPTLAGQWLPYVDEVIAYVAPAHLGAGPAVLQTQAGRLEDAVRWQLHDLCRVGDDARMTCRRSG